MLMSRHRATAAAAATATTATTAGLSIRRPWCSEDMDEEVSEHGVAGYLPRHTWMAAYLPRPAEVAGRGTAHHPQRVRAWLGLGLGL